MKRVYKNVLELMKTNIKEILKCEYATGQLAAIYVTVLEEIDRNQYFVERKK